MVCRVAIHLVLVPLMFMRASPVHTYLLDEVFAGMTGIHLGNSADRHADSLENRTASSDAACPSWAAEPEDHAADPLKSPVRPNAPADEDTVPVAASTPLAAMLVPVTTRSTCSDTAGAVVPPPRTYLPLLI